MTSARRAGLGLAAVALALIALYLARRPITVALARGPEYYATFASVGGLRPGDEVRYGGLVVGRVRSVQIDARDSTRIRAAFRVREYTPIRTDTRVSIVDATESVSRYLSLRAGSSAGARPLPPGSRLESEAGPTLEETLIHLTSVLQRTDSLLLAAAPLLRGDFFARLDRTTARLDDMTGAVVRSAGRWGPGLERAAGRMDEVMARTDRILATLDSTSPELRTASTEALLVLQDTRALVSDLRAGAAGGGGLAELMRDLTSAGDDLARLSARLERDPTSLLRSRGVAPKPAGPQVR